MAVVDRWSSDVNLRPGVRLQSVVCDTEVVVIRAPTGEFDLHCGGLAMVAMGSRPESSGSLQPGQDLGSNLGKRYISEEIGLEVLCTKAGSGSLVVAGVLLEEKKAKPLPSSD
jgi:hypothetical protein